MYEHNSFSFYDLPINPEILKKVNDALHYFDSDDKFVLGDQEASDLFDELKKLFDTELKSMGDKYEQHSKHDPKKCCELLYLSDEDKRKYNIPLSSMDYYNLYIDGEKVNDSVYTFDPKTVDDVSDNIQLNAARFVFLRRYDYAENLGEDFFKDVNDLETLTPKLDFGHRVIIDTRTGRELPVPISEYPYYEIKQNSNIIILKHEYYKEIQLMLLPVCVMLLPNEQIKDFWETESKFIVKCKNTKSDNSVNYDILYEVDKETGEANKMK